MYRIFNLQNHHMKRRMLERGKLERMNQFGIKVCNSLSLSKTASALLGSSRVGRLVLGVCCPFLGLTFLPLVRIIPM
jgi:hypothetical protein